MATSKNLFSQKSDMHAICCVNPSRSASARLRELSLQLPHLSDFCLTKQVFRGCLILINADTNTNIEPSTTDMKNYIFNLYFLNQITHMSIPSLAVHRIV